MLRHLALVAAVLLTALPAQAKTAEEICAGISTLPEKRECLAYVTGDRGDCSVLAEKDRCLVMMKFVRAPGYYSKCSVFSDDAKHYCVALTRRRVSDCKSIRASSNWVKGCTLTVQALVSLDLASDTGSTLMSVSTFRDQSDLSFSYFRPRSGVVGIEEALGDYNRTLDTAPTSEAKAIGLLEILRAIDEYRAISSSKRDVSKLYASAREELEDTITELIQQGDAPALATLRAIEVAAGKLFRGGGPRVSVPSGPVDQPGNHRLVSIAMGRLPLTDLFRESKPLPPNTGPGTAPRGSGSESAAMVSAMAKDGASEVERGLSTRSVPVVAEEVDRPVVSTVVDTPPAPKPVPTGTAALERTRSAAASMFGNTPAAFTYASTTTRDGVQKLLATRSSSLRRLSALTRSSKLSTAHRAQVVALLNSALARDPELKSLLTPTADTDPSARLHLRLVEDLNGLTRVLRDFEPVLNQLLDFLDRCGADPSDGIYKEAKIMASQSPLGDS